MHVRPGQYRNILPAFRALKKHAVKHDTVDIQIIAAVGPLAVVFEIDRPHRQRLRSSQHLLRQADAHVGKLILRCVIEHSAAAFFKLAEVLIAEKVALFNNRYLNARVDGHGQSR